MPIINSKSRKKERQVTAQKVIETRNNRTDEEQLALLDQRFGKGQGAAKERERLLSKITAHKVVEKIEPKEEVPQKTKRIKK